MLFFFNDTATTEIYTLSLHDALPISSRPAVSSTASRTSGSTAMPGPQGRRDTAMRRARVSVTAVAWSRSEEHTSELQSRQYLVCRLLLEKKNTKRAFNTPRRTIPTLY